MTTLNKIYEKAKVLHINDDSKIVIMSDVHRGAGNNYDNYIHNQNIFEASLLYYYKHNFTYIELGDGDEMWEVSNYKEIIEQHLSTFKILGKYHENNRLYMIYGNHDICKKSKSILEKYFYTHFNKVTQKTEKLLFNLNVYEALILKYDDDNDIFLVHGHQLSFLNSTLWRLSRFLVRHIWKHLEQIGIKDPTSAAKNYHISKKIEKKLTKWSQINHKIIITGHTHRSTFSYPYESLYFNAGSCIHPNGITCLEIENGTITLVKWAFKLKDNHIISVNREILTKGELIRNYF